MVYNSIYISKTNQSCCHLITLYYVLFWSGSKSVQLSRGEGLSPLYSMHVSVKDPNFQRNMSWHFCLCSMLKWDVVIRFVDIGRWTLLFKLFFLYNSMIGVPLYIYLKLTIYHYYFFEWSKLRRYHGLEKMNFPRKCKVQGLPNVAS